jgi:hypothetical protein
VTPTHTIHLTLGPPQEVLVYADADRIGQVGVDSRPAEGSAFWFTLPRLQLEEETIEDHHTYLE